MPPPVCRKALRLLGSQAGSSRERGAHAGPGGRPLHHSGLCPGGQIAAHSGTARTQGLEHAPDATGPCAPGVDCPRASARTL